MIIEEQFTDSEKLFAQGGSAGGLLIGAILNIEPSIWNGAIAAVPFVDAVTTMADPSIPLTSGEWDEWGDPRIKKYYDNYGQRVYTFVFDPQTIKINFLEAKMLSAEYVISKYPISNQNLNLICKKCNGSLELFLYKIKT